MEKFIASAKAQGDDLVTLDEHWRSYDIDQPKFYEEDTRMLGVSYMILVKKDILHMNALNILMKHIQRGIERRKKALERNLKGFFVWSGNEFENRGWSPKFWTVNLV